MGSAAGASGPVGSGACVAFQPGAEPAAGAEPTAEAAPVPTKTPVPIANAPPRTAMAVRRARERRAAPATPRAAARSPTFVGEAEVRRGEHGPEG